jgi:hypothetical protein
MSSKLGDSLVKILENSVLDKKILENSVLALQFFVFWHFDFFFPLRSQ